MASKRIGLVTGGLLAGALVLGTAGFTAAVDPTAAPAASPDAIGPGGMMGAGMMGGRMGAGMMGGQMGRMDAMHAQMTQSGVCDPAQMDSFMGR